MMHFVCCKCRKSFKRKQWEEPALSCPDCGEPAINVGRRFRPPKRTDKKQWAKVEHLIANGFLFQHVYDENHRQLPYPKTLDEAKIFVKKWKNQAVKK